MRATLKLHQTPQGPMDFPWIQMNTKRGRSVVFCSPRLKLMSWRGAFVSSVTCPLQNESNWRTCYDSRPRRWRSGSKTTDIKWRERGQSALMTSTNLQCCAGSLCQFWSEMANRIRTAIWTPKKEAASCRKRCHLHPSAFQVFSRYSNKHPLRFSPHISTSPTHRPPVTTSVFGETLSAHELFLWTYTICCFYLREVLGLLE